MWFKAGSAPAAAHRVSQYRGSIDERGEGKVIQAGFTWGSKGGMEGFCVV